MHGLGVSGFSTQIETMLHRDRQTGSVALAGPQPVRTLCPFPACWLKPELGRSESQGRSSGRQASSSYDTRSDRTVRR